MTTNTELFQTAQRHIPGGVNSPVRAFANVGGTPPFIAKGQGAYLWDVEGKRYTDYVLSWGPLIGGHAHPQVIAAVEKALKNGLSFGAPTDAETQLAEFLSRRVPNLEMLRLVSSGTEATMSAIRLARGFTKRDALVKFEGCYHGHADSLLVKAGSGLLTFGNPSSAGVPADFAKHTIVLPYNDTHTLARTFQKDGDKIAAVIVEPVAGNMNLVAPAAGFLEKIRELCTQCGALLIIDEVMTGFRVDYQSAQGLYNIEADLSTFGKVIGGGMPLAAFGGKREIMEHLAPLGAVYQAGTLSGNPLSVAAGLATLKLTEEADFYPQITQKTKTLCDGLTQAAQKNGIAFCAQNVGAMFGIYFADQPPQNLDDASAMNTKNFKQFFHKMLEAGEYLAPSPFEAGFLSSSHTMADIEKTIATATQIFKTWEA